MPVEVTAYASFPLSPLLRSATAFMFRFADALNGWVAGRARAREVAESAVVRSAVFVVFDVHGLAPSAARNVYSVIVLAPDVVAVALHLFVK